MKRLFALIAYLLCATVALAGPEIHRTKNLATKFSFDIDSVLTGLPIVSPTGLDCESRGYSDSVNPGSFADVAGAEVTDGTSTDASYVPLSAAELNFDLVDIRCKSTSTNAVTAVATINTMVNLTQIDGQATTGNNATLNLKQLNVQNSAGDAILATSSGSNGSGMILTGNGTGSGLKAIAGATGQGGNFQSTAGNGVLMQTAGGGGHGLSLVGAGSGNGLNASPGATGIGIKAVGGATSGAGFAATSTTGDTLTVVASAGNGNAVKLTGQGSGAGLSLVPGTTGNGLLSIGGATSGSAIKATGTAGNAIALDLTGQGSAAGLSATGGATGQGVKAVGGATSGAAIAATNTTGDAITADASAGNGDAVQLTGQGIGFGLNSTINGNITGNLSGSVGSVTGAVGSVTGSVGSVTGAVGSVTGAVGSVTGNVGGNVTGSTGSVTGAVGSVTGNVGGNVVGTIGVEGAQGTAQSVGASSIQLAASETYGDNALADNNSIWIVSATTGKGQLNCAKSNVGATDTVTTTRPWKIALTGATTYRVIQTPNCNPDKWPLAR